jgi:uncharacterized protein
MPSEPTSRVALEQGYVLIPELDGRGPVLLGSRSRATGRTFFPRRPCCPETFGVVDDVELSTGGQLYSWTYIAQRRPSGEIAKIGVGQVDLPEGTRIQAPLAGEPEEWQIGMAVELELTEVLDPRGVAFRDESGATIVTFGFRPLAAS